MSPRIRTVSVLGAGTMGAQIAAHFANAGIPVLLLDVTRDAARDGLARARKLKPDPFFIPDGPALVRTGGFDEDLAAIATSDWIIEAVVERLDVKQALFERVDRHRAADAIVSSNTSGIPIAAIVEGRSPSFRAHALGTHFFNPPRYLRLVEIIRTADTDPTVEMTVAEFCDHRLGKGVVAARDTPNFIANRIGLYGVMQILRAWAEAPGAGFSIEEIDAITGPAIGRPKSATFRTMDLAGIDVLAYVVRNLAGSLSREDDRAVFTLPPVVDDLIKRGWVGTKSGQGFYKKEASGEILALDPASMTYGAGAPARLPSLDAAKAVEDPGARIEDAFRRERQGRSVPARDAGAHPALRCPRRTRGGLLHRRRGPRDAVGLWLGVGTVRDLGCDRHRTRSRGLRRQRPAPRRPRRAGARCVPDQTRPRARRRALRARASSRSGVAAAAHGKGANRRRAA